MDKDRVAVITGATGNLGRVVAKSLAEQEARLALFSTSEDKLRTLADDLDLAEDRLLTGAFDLTQSEGAKAAASQVMLKFGRVDILAHVVGGWLGGKSISDLPAGEVSDMLNQHLWTTFNLAQAFGPHLTANGWGRIVVVSSPLAANPQAKMGAYVIGKASQEALVLTLARELAGSGVTANILQVRTIDARHERDEQPTAKNANWTTPEEITAAILYLCSDEARVINGARIPLYGNS